MKLLRLRLWLDKALPSLEKQLARLRLHLPPELSPKTLESGAGARSRAALARFLRSFATTLVGGYCLGTTLFTLVGYPAQVNGKSMQPSLNFPAPTQPLRFLGYDLVSDWVFVSTWRGRAVRAVQRGEVVVFTSPKDPPENVIKRMIGVEGDTVVPHSQSYLEEETVRVPTGHCWVEGDNWLNSVDSNRYGPIPMGLIFGVATHIVWPPHRWQHLAPLPPTKDRVTTPHRPRR